MMLGAFNLITFTLNAGSPVYSLTWYFSCVNFLEAIFLFFLAIWLGIKIWDDPKYINHKHR